MIVLHTPSLISVPPLDCSNIPALTQQLLEEQPIRGLDHLTPLAPPPLTVRQTEEEQHKASVCETELNFRGKTAGNGV